MFCFVFWPTRIQLNQFAEERTWWTLCAIKDKNELLHQQIFRENEKVNILTPILIIEELRSTNDNLYKLSCF
jgi:hypothetical protein